LRAVIVTAAEDGSGQASNVDQTMCDDDELQSAMKHQGWKSPRFLEKVFSFFVVLVYKKMGYKITSEELVGRTSHTPVSLSLRSV